MTTSMCTNKRHSRAAPGAVAAILGTVLALLISSCGALTPGAERATIVVTTNILGDITKNIVKDEADVVVLMPANADPHSFGISARQAGDMEQADLIVYNGLGLEEGVLSHIASASQEGVETLEVGAGIDPIIYRGNESDGLPDPHFWTDPQRVATTVDHIEAAILDHVGAPAADAIRTQASGYKAEISALDQKMEKAFAALPAPRRNIITNHHVFGYMAKRYGLTVIGAVVPSGTTLASPSASDLNDLAGKIRRTGVPAIFADSSQPDRLAQVLAQEANIDVKVVPLFSESLSIPGSGAGSYLEMMDTNTSRMTTALGGH